MFVDMDSRVILEMFEGHSVGYVLMGLWTDLYRILKETLIFRRNVGKITKQKNIYVYMYMYIGKRIHTQSRSCPQLIWPR